MRSVAEAALKMKVDTNLAGDVMSQLGLDAAGAVGFLDNLQASAQATGVSADALLNTIGKNSARWQAGGGDVAGLTALVVEQAHEFGPAGLRGAMSEVMREVDKGVIPAFQSLDAQLGRHDRRGRADLRGREDVARHAARAEGRSDGRGRPVRRRGRRRRAHARRQGCNSFL